MLDRKNHQFLEGQLHFEANTEGLSSFKNQKRLVYQMEVTLPQGDFTIS